MPALFRFNSIKICFYLCFLFGSHVLPSSAVAQNKNLSSLVDSTRDKITHRVYRISNRIDNFFGAERSLDEANGSRLQLSLANVFVEGDDPLYEAALRSTFRLPYLERKLNLVVESLRQDGTTVEDDQPDETPLQSLEEKDYSAAMKYFIAQSEKWNINTSTGIKFTIPLDPFIRFRLRRSWFPGAWEARVTQELYYFHVSKFGESTKVDFDRPINEKLLFRFGNRSVWTEELEYFIFDHSLSLFHSLKKDKAISYSGGLRSQSHPSVHVTSYGLSVAYRQKIFREWMYVDLRPALIWPKERGFEKTWVLTLKFEILFGEPNS